MKIAPMVQTEEEMKSKLDPIPGGPQDGVLVWVIDLGTDYFAQYKKYSRKILFGFELPTCRGQWTDNEGNEFDERRMMTIRFNRTLNRSNSGAPSNLLAFLENWKGGPLRQVDGKSTMDYSKLFGVPAKLQCKQDPPKANGDIWTNITAAYQWPKGEPVPANEHEFGYFNLDLVPPGENPLDYWPDCVHTWIRDKFLMESVELKEYMAKNPNGRPVNMDSDPTEEEVPLSDDGDGFPF